MDRFTGLSIIIPTVDETRGVAETVEILDRICGADDVAEMLIIYSPLATESHIQSLFSLARQYPARHIKVLPQQG